MQNIIPISYQLGGTTFNVKHVDNELQSNVVGYFNQCDSKIILGNLFKGKIVSSDYKEMTFCHELVHSILLTMGKSELSDNEEFVEGFANLLHQYFKSVKYE